MPYITIGKENSGEIKLHYEDHGSGKPVVLIHGWPLSLASWEKQVSVLFGAGFRVIAYDRRGFGYSSRPVTGYDYDTLANDLNALLVQLDLHDVTLVGFSMGGGEVARYLGKFGSERISKAVFISAIPPFLLKTPDNPSGVDSSVFDGIQRDLIGDRPKTLNAFLENFYNLDKLKDKLVSEQVVWASWYIAVDASPKGTFDCVSSWLTDFRDDIKRIDVPVLIIHGNADRILPITATAIPMSKMIKGSRFVEVEDGPHGLTWTHATKVNKELLEFLSPAAVRERVKAAMAR
ncbi:MAG: alpha/beta fold hydrolase [Deltaproteobacteria bacterium]